MKGKPWYIWLSMPVFLFLVTDSSCRITKYKKKNKIKLSDNRYLDWMYLWGKYVWNCMWLWGGLFMTPAFLLSTLIRLLENRLEAQWPETIDIIPFICLYLSGVLINYMHIQWRKNNISHLLEDYLVIDKLKHLINRYRKNHNKP